LLNRILALIGADNNVKYTVVHRILTIFYGAAVLFLVPFFLTVKQQGYYFSFSSLIALQVFFELGLNFVILQFFAHEAAFVHIDSQGNVTGSDAHVGRIRCLFRMLFKWYSYAALSFIIIVLPVGYFFFINNGDLEVREWLVPWVILTIFSGVNLFLSPFLAAVEGMGQVAAVAKLRISQTITSLLAIVVGLTTGLGLNFAPISVVVSVVFTSYWLWSLRSWLRHFLSLPGDRVAISWLKEIFPYQWRIAVSWLAGYFVFYLLSPITFYFYGAEEAGKIGLALLCFKVS